MIVIINLHFTLLSLLIATGRYNLMRNMGGELRHRHRSHHPHSEQQFSQNQLAANVSGCDFAFQRSYHALKGSLIARGSDTLTAENQTMATIYGTVRPMLATTTFSGT